MTNIIRRSPFSEVRHLQEQFDRLLEPFGARRFEDDDLIRGAWVPPVDVSEEGDRIVVRAELPGMNEDEIEVEFENGVLTLKGERKFQDEVNKENYYRIERSYGTFIRSFTLPRTSDPEGIVAKYDKGILEISVAKREEAKPRQIKIEVEKA